MFISKFCQLSTNPLTYTVHVTSDQFRGQGFCCILDARVRSKFTTPCRAHVNGVFFLYGWKMNMMSSSHVLGITLQVAAFGHGGAQRNFSVKMHSSVKALAHQDSPQVSEHTDMAAKAVDSVAATALRSVLQRVQLAADRASRPASQVRVVAVSKTKPSSLIQEVYDAGHRYFGENYVQEILDKSPELPGDIQWHFIGHLQSNKAKALVETVILGPTAGAILTTVHHFLTWAGVAFPLNGSTNAAGVPNLYMVEGVDSPKVANHLDRAVAGFGRSPLKVLVQVNTSGEESKFGLEPSQCLELARHVKFECPNLVFSGLMTIGMADYTSTPENFRSLANCRDNICRELQISPDQCELSMGMSGDFELAIQMGSTNVRIGSTIFGPRSYPAKN